MARCLSKNIPLTILVSLTLFSGRAFSVSELSVIGMFGLGNVSKNFQKSIVVPNPDGKYHRFVYGNEHYGYFDADNHKTSAEGSIEISLVPPGYKYPIEFYGISEKGHLEKVYSKTFQSAVPEAFSQLIVWVERGTFSSPFHLLTSSLPVSDELGKLGLSFAYITNRYGEIVWIHTLQNGETNYSQPSTAKPLGDGRYGFIGCHEVPFGELSKKALKQGQKACYLEVADFMGNIRHLTKTNINKLPSAIFLNDFVLDPTQKSALVIAEHPLFAYHFDDRWYGSPKKFAANLVQKIDFSKNKGVVIANLFDQINPIEDNHNFFDGMKISEIPQEIHGAQSLRYEEKQQGYLLSLSSLDKIALLSNNWQSLIWTVGSDTGDTYRIKDPEDAFAKPSYASLTSSDVLLVFDNKGKRPGVHLRWYQLDKRSQEAKLIREIDTGIGVKSRGSVEELGNGNVVAFFPAAKLRRESDAIKKALDELGGGPGLEVLAEYDSTGRLVARQIIAVEDHPQPKGSRGLPISTIGTDKFLGFDLPTPL